jgi:hypothetical protein
LFVHIPSYESKGSATPFVINRCLAGIFVMQLTMMGVLALKSGEPSDTMAMSAAEQWSEYAKMVIGVIPLLLMTYLVYSLLKQAYEKQIRNVPLEVLGAAQRSFMSGNTEPFTMSESQELSDISADIRLRNRLSVFSNASTTYPIESGSEDHKSKLAGRHSMASILDPTIGESSPFYDLGEQDGFNDDSFQHSSYQPIENENEMMVRHVEPPMTRVSGILDIPIGTAMIKHGDQLANQEGEPDDLLLYSYVHPALIGRLPVAWLPNQQFNQLRKHQIEEQKILLQRLTSRQRLSVENPLEEEAEKTGAIRAFIDGFTSWIHLALA